MYSSTVLEEESPRSRCPKDWFLVKAVRGTLFHVSLQLLGVC
jgi:hypothetical protein